MEGMRKEYVQLKPAFADCTASLDVQLLFYKEKIQLPAPAEETEAQLVAKVQASTENSSKITQNRDAGRQALDTANEEAALKAKELEGQEAAVRGEEGTMSVGLDYHAHSCISIVCESVVS